MAKKKDAFATIRTLLTRYGLGSLGDWAWNLITNDRSLAEIGLELRERPEFRERFAAIFERERLGLSPMTPNDIIEYENTVRQMARAFDLPSGFITQEQINGFIAGDMSSVELQERMEQFVQAAFQVPQETRAQLSVLYGVNEGQLAAFFMDPDRGSQLIQQQFLSSQVAGAAQRQQFGQLTRSEAERLATTTTPEQAEQGFGVLQQARELFTALPGTQEQAISRQTQLGLVAGEAAAQEEVERQARRRAATFEAGGQFATTEAGITGLRRA